MEFLKRLGNIYWHAEFYHDFLRLTTGYTLASAEDPSNSVRTRQGERESQVSDEIMTTGSTTNQRDGVHRIIQPLADTPGATVVEHLDTSRMDGAVLDDPSMLAHADQIFQQWLEGDTNWLEEYTNFYSAAL